MHYYALVCTHMAMQAEWKRGSHSLSYRRAGPCETPSPLFLSESALLNEVFVKVFTGWRQCGAEMFSQSHVSFSALSLLAYSFKLALCIAHTRPLPRGKKKQERAAVCLCVVSPFTKALL